MKFSRHLALSLALVATGVLAAGDGDHKHGDGDIGKPGVAEDVGRTIDVTLQDIYFEPESITVAAGETIRFRVNNTGRLLHEFSINTAAKHADHKGHMLAMMQSGVLLPDRVDHVKMAASGMTHAEPNVVLLDAGASGDIIWNFSNAAEVEFACTVPGHYESGMVGEFKVVKK